MVVWFFSLSVCLFVCLSVCLSVGLSTGLQDQDTFGDAQSLMHSVLEHIGKDRTVSLMSLASDGNDRLTSGNGFGWVSDLQFSQAVSLEVIHETPRPQHGCRWETIYIFAYCGLVGNPHLTAKISSFAPLSTSTKIIISRNVKEFLVILGIDPVLDANARKLTQTPRNRKRPQIAANGPQKRGKRPQKSAKPQTA